MTREELRDYVDVQRSLNNIPYHVYSALIDGIDTLEQEPKSEWEQDHAILKAYSDGANEVLDKIRAEIWDLQYGDEEKSMTDENRADAYNNAIRQVIEIIDKYKAESENP